MTDHKPLLAILGSKSKLPDMVAARLQRYAILLCGYNYTIEFRSSEKHGNADALSRLPLDGSSVSVDSDPPLMVNFVSSPVSSKDISAATKSDRVLKVVHDCVLKNIQFPYSNEFTPFRNNKDNLNVEGGIILKDHLVIVPESLRSKMLSVSYYTLLHYH